MDTFVSVFILLLLAGYFSPGCAMILFVLFAIPLLFSLIPYVLEGWFDLFATLAVLPHFILPAVVLISIAIAIILPAYFEKQLTQCIKSGAINRKCAVFRKKTANTFKAVKSCILSFTLKNALSVVNAHHFLIYIILLTSWTFLAPSVDDFFSLTFKVHLVILPSWLLFKFFKKRKTDKRLSLPQRIERDTEIWERIIPAGILLYVMVQIPFLSANLPYWWLYALLSFLSIALPMALLKFMFCPKSKIFPKNTFSEEVSSIDQYPMPPVKKKPAAHSSPVYTNLDDEMTRMSAYAAELQKKNRETTAETHAAAAKENKEKNRHSAPLACDPISGSEAVVLTLMLNEEAVRAQAQTQEHAPASPDTDAAADTAEGNSYDGDSGSSDSGGVGSSDGGDSGRFFDFGGWGDGGDGGD